MIHSPSNNATTLTGTGVVAIVAAKCGATRCVVTDENIHAVENAKLNVQKESLGTKIEVKHGDVFEALDEDERFDVVFWAHPFNRSDVEVESGLRTSGKDYRYKSLEKYLSGASQRINWKGRILLGTGNSADLERIIRLACKYRLNINVVAQELKRLGEDSDAKFAVEYLLCEWVRWE